MAAKRLTVAILESEAAAEAASESLKAWEKETGEVKLATKAGAEAA